MDKAPVDHMLDLREFSRFASSYPGKDLHIMVTPKGDYEVWWREKLVHVTFHVPLEDARPLIRDIAILFAEKLWESNSG